MIQPLGIFVLVEEITGATKTKSGLLKPEDPGSKTESIAVKGIVRGIGKDVKNPGYKLGDTVLVSKWEVQKTSDDGKKYILVKNEFVFGVIRNGK